MGADNVSVSQPPLLVVYTRGLGLCLGDMAIWLYSLLARRPLFLLCDDRLNGSTVLALHQCMTHVSVSIGIPKSLAGVLEIPVED